MKTHHYIFLTAALFVIVFYDQDMGLNLGILGIVYDVTLAFNLVVFDLSFVPFVFLSSTLRDLCVVIGPIAPQ